MKKPLYVETTVISYLAARPIADLVTAPTSPTPRCGGDWRLFAVQWAWSCPWSARPRNCRRLDSMAHVEAHPWVDPIVDEVRAARESLAAHRDYDVDRIAAALAERSRKAGRRIASPTPPVTPGTGPDRTTKNGTR